ncbi:FG-GAP repeat-containing protein [Thermomonospora echinospora]|uniref:FG-GAP repeat-containing protein n=1 Tax=Thermomonospora echinospora TaxID=1992 RepID=A0A1H6CU31_9ACTN|nr:FG-GAP-like repeat-containing protein [Thermomonospora echinospora]SEG76307.1 FG-GAP repeat-containing protein [Thermomonospora echinospora]
MPALAVAALTAAAGLALPPTAAAAAQTSALTLKTTVRTEPTKPVRLSGRLTFGGRAPGSPQQVKLTRALDGQVRWTGTVTTKADGTFSYTDGKLGFGVFTYTAEFAGTTAQNPAGARARTSRRVPGDINRDGRAELRTGAAGRPVNGLDNAGALAVTAGSPTGATGPATLYDQDTPGIADVAEANDWFGYSHTGGDFNGDGYEDVAVGAPAEEGRKGAVNVIYGSATGLTSNGNRVLRHSLGSFGLSVASLDVNNDGYDDLAVGAPGKGQSVLLYLGGPGGVGTQAPLRLRPGAGGVPGKAHNWESFGWGLAGGDLDGDGYDDLVVANAYDWSPKYGTYGSIVALYGKKGGGSSFRFRSAQFWDKDSRGIYGTVGSWKKDQPDHFGWSVAVADYNGDGRDDVAVSAPGTPVKRSGKTYQDAGTVNLIYGSAKGLTATGNKQYTLDTAGVPGAARAEDRLGMTVTGGDANGDGYAELAVSGQGRQMVVVLRGAKKALTTSGARWITQNSAGVPGTTRKNSVFGSYMAFLRLRGARTADLVVGDIGANARRGSVTVLPNALGKGAYLVKLPALPGDNFGVVNAPVPSGIPLVPSNTTGRNRPPA